MNQLPTTLPRCALPVIESWPLRGAAIGALGLVKPMPNPTSPTGSDFCDFRGV